MSFEVIDTEQSEPIIESEMSFGIFQKNQVFHIEKDELYSSFKNAGVKTCEFVLQRDNKIYFIEAKKGCPNYDEARTTDEKREKFEEYFRDISQKMRDSLNLYLSILLNKNCTSVLPENMRITDLADYQLRFVLVIKDAEAEWLIHYPDIFREKLRNEMRIWNIPAFMVLTEEKARQKHFVV